MKWMISVFCLLSILASANAWSGFGGSRSSSFSGARSSYSSSRSSFGGSRSSGRPATISRPSYSRGTSSTGSTTIINNGGYGGGGGGFWNGYFMASMMNRPVAYIDPATGLAAPMPYYYNPLFEFVAFIIFLVIVGMVFCWLGG